MQQDNVDTIYAFLKEINAFKSQQRFSLITEGGRRESDAEHTWHLVMSVWLYSSVFEKSIDLLKAMKLALVHDLVEIYAGDVYGGAPEEQRRGKQEREQAAAEKLFSQLPHDFQKEFTDLWNEYEQRETVESQYVWALDKIAPSFQLAITKTDAAEHLPTDTARFAQQEDTITNLSPSLGEVLNKIRKDRGSGAG